MKATREALSPTRIKLTVEVPFDELRPSVDAAYKKIASQVRVPGFRPGKVPARIIDQRVGRGHILDEALQEALPRFYSEAVESESLDVLSRPEVDVAEFADGAPLVFTAEVDVRPEIELPSTEGLVITVDDVAVSDADVEEQLDSMRDRFSTLQPVERPVAEGDYLTIDLAASVDGETVEGAGANGMSYEVGGDNVIAGMDEALIGAVEGDQRTFQTELQAGEFAGRTADVSVTVRSIKEKVRPDLDDDFATTASEFDTLDELVGDVRTRLERVKRLEQGMQARDRVLERVLELTDVPLPESVVQSEVEAREHSLGHQLEQVGLDRDAYLTAENKTAEEFGAEVREGSEKAVKAQFVLDALASREELNVSQEELTDHLIRRAQQSQMAPQEFANQVMQQGQVGMLMAEVVRGKALATLLESATVTDASGRPVDLAALSADADQLEAEALEDDDLDDDELAGDTVDDDATERVTADSEPVDAEVVGAEVVGAAEVGAAVVGAAEVVDAEVVNPEPGGATAAPADASSGPSDAEAFAAETEQIAEVSGGAEAGDPAGPSHEGDDKPAAQG